MIALLFKTLISIGFHQLEGLTIGGKTMVEHLETINHRDAILFIEDLVSNKEAISEWNIRNIHSLILKEIDKENAGKYRTENVLISGAKHIPPKHYEIIDLMQKLIEVYSNNWENYHPIFRATLLHGELVKIHPFIDGNGRTARLLLNFELMRNGYIDIINELDEENYIRQGSYRSKSVAITEEGIRLAQDLLNKYNIKDWEEV